MYIVEIYHNLQTYRKIHWFAGKLKYLLAQNVLQESDIEYMYIDILKLSGEYHPCITVWLMLSL